VIAFQRLANELDNGQTMLGTSRNWLEFLGLAGASSQDIEFNPLGDDDGDGILNQDEAIIVTSTPQMREAARIAYERATTQINFSLDGGAGLVAILGRYFGPLGLGSSAAIMQEINNHRDELINQRAATLYFRDGHDGIYDGESVTDRAVTMPPIPW
jgi:hypothetical protein